MVRTYSARVAVIPFFAMCRACFPKIEHSRICIASDLVVAATEYYKLVCSPLRCCFSFYFHYSGRLAQLSLLSVSWQVVSANLTLCHMGHDPENLSNRADLPQAVHNNDHT